MGCLKISDPATDPPNASKQAAARWMCTSQTGAKDHARSKLGPTTVQPEVLYHISFQHVPTDLGRNELGHQPTSHKGIDLPKSLSPSPSV